MTPALSGMTKLTQLPWPKGLTTPCLSLPPMYTWASCARRRGAQGSIEGQEFSLRPALIPFMRGVTWQHSLPICTCPRLASAAPSGSGTSCSLCLEPSPAFPEQSLLPCPGETSPGSVQCGVAMWPGAAPEAGRKKGSGQGHRRACWEARRERVLAQAGVEGQPRGLGLRRGPRAPGCAQAHRPLPLWLLLQEAAAWAAVPVLGGGRVVAGRGLDQECVSRNVAALPVGGGAGAGWRGRGS